MGTSFSSSASFWFGPRYAKYVIFKWCILSGLIAWFTPNDGLNQIEEQPESKNEEENIGNIEIDEVSDNASISLDLGMVYYHWLILPIKNQLAH